MSSAILSAIQLESPGGLWNWANNIQVECYSAVVNFSSRRSNRLTA